MRDTPHEDRPRLGPAELTRLLTIEFPQSFEGPGALVLERAEPMIAQVRLPYDPRHLRPGGTISGPAMFAVADCALYIAILATIGWKPLSVTTSLTINFLSKPAQADVIATCRMLKVGKLLAVGEVALRSHGEETIVAHATGTYAIPPR